MDSTISCSITRPAYRRWKAGRDMADVTIREAMRLGVQHHRAGRLAEAEAVYRQVLEQSPAHADAQHLLGVCLHQRGRPDEAIERIERAIAAQPLAAEYHHNLGRALRAAGDPAGAITSYRRALELKPAYADARRALEELQAEPHRAAGAERQPVWPEPGGKPLSVLLACAGDSLHSIRAVKSLTAGAGPRCDVHVACSACCAATLAAVRSSYDAGRIATVFDSAEDLGRALALAQMAEVVRTPYALLIDDAAHAADGWLDALIAFIEQNHPFDVAGFPPGPAARAGTTLPVDEPGMTLVRSALLPAAAARGPRPDPTPERRMTFNPAVAAVLRAGGTA